MNFGDWKNQSRIRAMKSKTTCHSCWLIRPSFFFLSAITLLIRSWLFSSSSSFPRVSLCMRRIISQAIRVLTNIKGTQKAIQVA